MYYREYYRQLPQHAVQPKALTNYLRFESRVPQPVDTAVACNYGKEVCQKVHDACHAVCGTPMTRACAPTKQVVPGVTCLDVYARMM